MAPVVSVSLLSTRMQKCLSFFPIHQVPSSEVYGLQPPHANYQGSRYNLWLERGSPYGSLAQDWAEAERQLSACEYAIGPCLGDECDDATNGFV